MKKRLLSILLAIALLFSLVPGLGSVAVAEESHKYTIVFTPNDAFAGTGWTKVGFYYWNNTGLDWPGTEMSQSGGSYTLTFETSAVPTGFIINDGNIHDYNDTAAYQSGNLAFVLNTAVDVTLNSGVTIGTCTITEIHEYTVTLTGGEHATPDKATTQTGLTGAMETVTYTAHDGYHFDDFTPIESHGITVQKTDAKTVTVSGTPDADVTIAVPNAAEDLFRTVTVPTALTVEHAGWTAASGITAASNENKTLKVLAYSANGWAMKSGDNSVSYVLSTADGGDKTTEWSFTPAELRAEGGTTKALGAIVGAIDALAAGTYTDTVTFTAPRVIKVENTLNWDNVKVYAWDDNLTEYFGAWPGMPIEAVNGVFEIELPEGATGIIVNSGTVQTEDITDLSKSLYTFTGETDGMGHYTLTGSGENAPEVYGTLTLTLTVEAPITYTVTLTGGEHATPDKATTQTGLIGAMETVTYTAHDGYHFDDFTPIESHGITVQKTDSKTVTVSGTPDADVTIAVPDAVHDTYTVTLTGGEHATPDKATTQTGLTGAMETVTYTAHDGYHFDDFTPIESHGITVQKTGNKTVTVSGTPDADVTIAVPDAVHDTYTVTLTGGEHATPDKATTQTGLTGAMETVTYTAHDGYHFDDFMPIESHGITAQKTGAKTVTVSGTPDADVTIAVPNAVHDTYTVTLTGGEHATPDKETTQTGLTGAMETVTYTAHDGYHFEDFTPIESHGITVQKTDNKTVTVSGTPDADVTIAVPDAAEDLFRTVTVPSTLTLEHAGWTAASGITAASNENKTLKVLAHSANGWTMKSGDNSVSYVLSTADGGDKTTEWSFTPAELLAEGGTTKALGAIVGAIDALAAGTYTDTVTFTAPRVIKVENTLNWDNVKVYAWDDNLTEYFGAWPGKSIEAVNGVFEIELPEGATGIIVNSGTVQTEDITDLDKAVYTFTGETDGMGHYTLTGSGENAPEVYGTLTLTLTVEAPTTYTVTLTGGEHATPDKATTQSGLTGAMETVTYTAADGYHFDDFTPIESHGITVQKTGNKTVTVSGTPDADVTIAVPNAVHDTYTVTLTGGEHATPDKATTQTGLTGAMETVTYTAHDGYHFDDFTPIESHGITVQKTDAKTVTVSGTPDADVTIAVPNAAEDLFRTVTVPTALTVEHAGWTAASGITAASNENKTLKVLAYSANGWAMKSGDNSVSYVLSTADGGDKTTEWSFTPAELRAEGGTTKALGAIVGAIDALAAGTYTDTVTFTAPRVIKVENTLNWDNVKVYAWDTNLTEYFGAWPGMPIEAVNGVFEIELPEGATGIIVNSGTVQTADITDLDKAVYTFTGETDGMGHYTLTGSGENTPEVYGTLTLTLTVEAPTTYTVTAPTASAITYGQKLSDSTLSGGKMVFGDVEVAGTFTWKDATVKPVVADSQTTEYLVVFTPSDTASYPSAEFGIKLTVNPKPAKITADDKTKTYGDPDPEFTGTVEGVLAGDELNYSFERRGGDNVGQYKISVSIGANDNYDVTAVDAKLTIVPKAAFVTADAKSKVYDNDASTDPALTATVAGAVNGETLNYTLSRTAGQNVDEYDITVTLGSNPNYTVTSTGAKFTITPKAAKITADAKSKVYDNDASTDPVLTATVEGVVAGDALSYTLSRAEGQNVGQYDITVTPGSNPNYAVETVGAKLTITQKAAKITADAMSKVYGSDDPELTATVEGVVAGDTLNYTLSRAAGQNVGQYDITVTLGSNPNYAVETVGAKLTITQKTATVKADDMTKTYGDADPALTAQTAGIVGTDTLNYTLSRAEGDNVGTYTITVTLGSNPNYAVTATGATLTITQKAATIKADDKTKTYGAADPELTAVIDGQVGRDELNYTLSRTEGDTVGDYAITVTLGSNPNYTIETTGAKLTITAATPTLSDVSATELTYGDTLAAGTLSGTAKNPNNGANVAGEWAFADVTIAPAVADSETTEYAVVFRPTDTLNYNEASTVVTVKVNKADPTFTPPTPKVLSYTGEPQELVNPGYTEDGTMLYSLDGEHFDAAIPTATMLDTYFVWYMVKGDANHNDTEPVRLTIGIGLTLYGADVSSLEIGFIENGERLYRYDVRIKNLPEAFKTVGMQVFLSYDTELLTLKRIESDFDWISSESNNRLLLAWASDVEVPLTNDQVVFSLIFAASDDAAGEQTAIPFIANVHGMTSIVSALVDGEIVDYDAATIDGCIRFAAPLLGDTNCDGVITGADAALILRAIVGLDTLSAQGALNADVDGDLEITAEDAVLILRWIVGLIAQFPAAAMD